MSNRITICFPTRGVMFEGQSALDAERRAVDAYEARQREDEDEACPPTVRSADSGMFPSVKPKGQGRLEESEHDEEAA